MNPVVKAFFDDATNTISYIVQAPGADSCIVIDPVLDYNPASGQTATDSADNMIQFIVDHALRLDAILETHAHADHLSAAPYLKQQLGGFIAIGKHIADVQGIFRDLFNLEKSFLPDGSQFDRLLSDGDTIETGGLRIDVLHTPGHTPACVTYVIGDAAFVGDTLFMPDYGTARADFPGGDARALYRSIQKLLALPDNTRLFMCHDYKPSGRDQYLWQTTVAEEKRHNIHVGSGVTEDDFVAMRESRDATLSAPTLLLPSVQVNIRAGELPPAENNGVSYLKIPVNQL